jgi:hypothetical protein
VGENHGREFCLNARLPRMHLGSFTCRKSTTWDRRIYFPSEGRRAEDFFALKNPTASAGFEPANLDTKSQHDTPRPPKPLRGTLGQTNYQSKCSISDSPEPLTKCTQTNCTTQVQNTGTYNTASNRQYSNTANG